MKKDTKTLKDTSGVSLIIAIIFVSAFLLVIAGLAEAQISTIHAIGNRENEGKARYLAEGAAEHALLWAATHGIGANTIDDPNFEDYVAPLYNDAAELGFANCADTDEDSTNGNQPCINIEVIGRSSETVQIAGAGPSYFSIPMAGTGDAGENCTLVNASSDANDECNWNKLSVGQTVEIPLYYVDDSGLVQKLDVSSAGDFLLRIRAPGSEELFPLFTDEDNYRHIEKDPVLVQWTISGTSTAPGGQVAGRTLIAKDNKEGQFRLDENEADENTEISGGRINAARIAVGYLNDFIVLGKSNFRNDIGRNITSQGGREAQTISTFLNQVNNPVLRLSLVGQPRRNTSSALGDFDPDNNNHVNSSVFDISYLEYQFLTDSSHAVSDSKQIIIGWAEFGGFRKEVRREIQREPTLGGFVLEQF